MWYYGFYYCKKTPIKFVGGKKVRYEKYKQEHIIFLIFAVDKQEERNGGNELKHIIVAQITNIAQKNTGNTDKGRQE